MLFFVNFPILRELFYYHFEVNAIFWMAFEKATSLNDCKSREKSKIFSLLSHKSMHKYLKMKFSLLRIMQHENWINWNPIGVAEMMVDAVVVVVKIRFSLNLTNSYKIQLKNEIRNIRDLMHTWTQASYKLNWLRRSIMWFVWTPLWVRSQSAAANKIACVLPNSHLNVYVCLLFISVLTAFTVQQVATKDQVECAG